MVIRRILAAFFVFLFIIVSLPTFLVYGLSRTYFSGSFYEQDEFIEVIKNSTSKIATDHFYKADATIQKYFQKSDIKKEIDEVLTPEVIGSITSDFGKQIEKLKLKPAEPATLSLKVLRESLLTVTHNLAFHLFQNLPVCKKDQLPEVNQEGIPTCVPNDVDYEIISAPLGKQFEKVVFTVAPEQLEIDLISAQHKNTIFYYIFLWIDHIKFYLLGSMLFLMTAIALALYSPISSMVRFESLAFLISGFGGFLSSILLESLPALLLANAPTNFTSGNTSAIFNGWKKEDLQQLIEYILSSFSGEVQKISFIFLALGGALFFTHILLKRKNTLE